MSRHGQDAGVSIRNNCRLRRRPWRHDVRRAACRQTWREICTGESVTNRDARSPECNQVRQGADVPPSGKTWEQAAPLF
jgi:hypothetical protein